MSDESSPVDTANVPTSHPIGFWFFFAGEFAERCSYYGMRAILFLYMTDQIGIQNSNAMTYMSLFMAGCYFLPMLGSYIADNYIGKYWTIVGFSIPYVLGQVMVGIESRVFLIISLCLLAMGSGVIKPNISTLMGMTYDQQRPGQTKLRSNAFSWFYMAINIGAFLSQFSLPLIRGIYGYQIAFTFPAVFMAIALIVFALGKKYYAVEVIGKQSGTPETGGASRIDVLKQIGPLFFLIMFFWAIFDQSSSSWIQFAKTHMDLTVFNLKITADQIQFVNALMIILFLPLSVMFFNYCASRGRAIKATDKILAGFLLTGLAMAILSFAGFQAGEAKKLTKLSGPNGSMLLPNVAEKTELNKVNGEATLTLGSGENVVSINAKDWKYNEVNDRLMFGNGTIVFNDQSKLTFVDGILKDTYTTEDLKAENFNKAIEFSLKVSTDETITKSLEEVRKKANGNQITGIAPTEYVTPAERVTIWWQILAYIVITVAEILISVTGLELAFIVAPQSMKSFVTACWLFTVGCANLFVNVPFAEIYPLVSPGIYFAILTFSMVIVVALFLGVAKKFNASLEGK